MILDDITRSKIYGAVLEVVQRDLGKMQLQLKRAARKSKDLDPRKFIKIRRKTDQCLVLEI